jgi:hypothetical protein
LLEYWLLTGKELPSILKIPFYMGVCAAIVAIIGGIVIAIGLLMRGGKDDPR